MPKLTDQMKMIKDAAPHLFEKLLVKQKRRHAKSMRKYQKSERGKRTILIANHNWKIQRFMCACGHSVSNGNKTKHLVTEKHSKAMGKKKRDQSSTKPTKRG
jgi:hypothetical protein